MSDFEHAESAREELLSLLNISRDNVSNYDELAELAGRCLEEQFEAGRRAQQVRIDLSDDRTPPQYIEDGQKIVFGPINDSIILRSPLICCDCGLAHDMNYELERVDEDSPLLTASPVRNEELTAKRLHIRGAERLEP